MELIFLLLAGSNSRWRHVHEVQPVGVWKYKLLLKAQLVYFYTLALNEGFFRALCLFLSSSLPALVVYCQRRDEYSFCIALILICKHTVISASVQETPLTVTLL